MYIWLTIVLLFAINLNYDNPEMYKDFEKLEKGIKDIFN